jgi:hypothetical protein
MTIQEPTAVVRLRQKAESEEARLAGIQEKLDGVERTLDRYERQAAEADARGAHLKSKAWLNPAGFALTLGGASLAMLGGALGGGMPVMAVGVAVALGGVGCIRASLNHSQNAAQAAMDSAMARLGAITVGYDQKQLREEREAQSRVAHEAREAYDSARQPLDLLEPGRATVDERADRIVVGSVVIPKR